jgi:hypothetical protein
MTVAELCDQYLAGAQGRIKASTLSMDRGRIDCHVRPLLGRRAVTGLMRRDIERFQSEPQGKPQDRAGKPAARAKQPAGVPPQPARLECLEQF